MFITHLQKRLTVPVNKTPSPRVIFWFSLSLTFSAIYSISSLQAAFISKYVVSGDTRPHLFWAQQFFDVDLFPIGQIILASIAMFFAAHLVLLKLYLTSRYTNYSLRFFIALATEIVLKVILDLDTVFRLCMQRRQITLRG